MMPDNAAVDDKNDYVPWSELLNARHAASLTLVCLSIWLHAADSMIVATMMPSMIADIGGTNVINWSVSLYQIGSIIAGATSAWLSIRFGLRSPMSGAALLFGLGCMVSAMAPDMWIVLIGRALQGIGGGCLVAMSFVGLSTIFPKRLIPRAMAIVSTLWGTSAFLGPMIGGFFVEYADWRTGFWFFTAQAVFLCALILFVAKVPEKPSNEVTKRVPLLRLMILSTGVVLVCYAGVEISILRTSLLVASGLGCLLLFLWIDAQQGENRLLPVHPFNLSSRVGASLSMILAFTMSTIAIMAYGPLLLIYIHQIPVIVAGYVIACTSVGWTIFAVMVSGSPEKHDGKMIACGMVMLTISIIGFAYSIPHGPVWLVALFALMEGGGFGIAWMFILRRTTAGASPLEVQRISGAIPTVQRLGYALGAAYAGIVANAVGFETIASPEAAAHAAEVIFLACLPFAVFGLFAMIRLCRQFRPNG